MYSFPGANHNLRRISIIAMAFSLCLAQQAQAGEVTISNRNCAWQGLFRTNQAKIHLRGAAGVIQRIPNPTNVPNACSDEWITLHVGKSQFLSVVGWIKFDNEVAVQCKYFAEAEGTISPSHTALGKDVSKFECELDGIGNSQYQAE
jgi:hypothetical protein